MNSPQPGRGRMTSNPTLAIVIGDFSREATFRFCSQVARFEREVIRAQLPQGASFYDEYRQIAMNVICDLSFIKAPFLKGRSQQLLDDRVLVGFPQGIPAKALQAQVAVLVLQALMNASERGIQDVLVLFPCNTMAPICWDLASAFGDLQNIIELIDATDFDLSKERQQKVAHLISNMRLTFPTPPEAVIEYAVNRHLETILPLGTIGIVDVFRQALSRSDHHLELVRLDDDQQEVVLEAIKSGISADKQQSSPATHKLKTMIIQTQIQHRYGVAVVLACTDLINDFGIDSSQVYAEAVVRHVYGVMKPPGSLPGHQK
jgi:aspartate/glutamate racemase